MQINSQSIKNLPESSGVYLYKDKQESILYIGKAKNLKKRVSSYFKNNISDPKTLNLVSQIRTITTIDVQSEFEALLLEAKLISKYKPKYNVVWKDDKHYIYIKITDESFPRILFSRKEDDKKAVFFGPFPSSTIVREILSLLRRIFPYCNQNRKLKKPCFYTHLNLCRPCPAEIVKMKGREFQTKRWEYLYNVRQIKILLDGKINNIRNIFERKMQSFSIKSDYEKAAEYRNRLFHLEYLAGRYHPPEAYVSNANLLKDLQQKELENLKHLLITYFPAIDHIDRIECYDISNISGKFAAGSMVTFVNGCPEKKSYRHFRIRFKNTPDDFAMLSEVMKRRLAHSEWNLPHLMVVDGGKPQLATLQKVLANIKIVIPLIGLVKDNEELVIPKNGSFIKLRLPRNCPALQLIQRLRDEAHRFAHKYHEMLRLRNLYALSS